MEMRGEHEKKGKILSTFSEASAQMDLSDGDVWRGRDESF